jgi:hypothetical protein
MTPLLSAKDMAAGELGLNDQEIESLIREDPVLSK